MIDQTVWLAARATSYTVVCEECAAEHGYLGARVEGRLELEREHTATCCTRGIRSASSALEEPVGVHSTESGMIARVPATVIVGAQWGDEGKGKIVDLLAQSSDVVCRYQGGPNAGHTVIVDGETFKFRHLPSGILSGKRACSAPAASSTRVLLDEIDGLEQRGISSEPLGSRQRAPDHALAHRDRRRRREAARSSRSAPPAAGSARLRGQGRTPRHPRGTTLDPKILRQKIETARGEEHLARAGLRAGAVRARGGRRAARGVRAAAAAVRRRHVAARRRGAPRRQGRPARRRAGDAARPRPRHVSLRDLVEPDRGRAATGIGIGPTDRPRDRRLEGVRHPRRRRAVPERDGAGAGGRGARRPGVRHRHRPRPAPRLARPSSRSATRCA